MTPQAALPGFEPARPQSSPDHGVGGLTATLDAPRVFDDQGHQLCPSCGSQLRRGWFCTPCNRVGATAPTLLEGDQQ